MVIVPVLWISFHLLAISNALELIINPSSNTVSCGTSDDCTVICNETEACKSTTFLFYNNNINITCAATYSCSAAQIHTFNVTKLTAHATGGASFFSGRLFTSSNDDDINFNCGPGKEACFAALFYYQNQGESKHNCDGYYSCRTTMIDAISAVSLSCKTDRACQLLGLFLSRNKTMNQQSSITIAEGYANIETNNAQTTMHIYSFYPFNKFVSTDGTSFDAIYFIYGSNFDRFCIASDTKCMDSIEDQHYDEFTIIDVYRDGNQHETATFNDNVVIFGEWIFDTFRAPSIPNTKTLSIVCVACYSSNLQLGAVANAVVSGLIYDSSIYGPTDYFILNNMHQPLFNLYFLSNTSTIVANSFGKYANVYFGDSIDVRVNCHTVGSPYYQCTKTHIWSTLQQDQVHLAHDVEHYWNIDTSTELIIHFTFEPHICTYYNYSSNCSFMATLSPTHATMDPTRNPSLNPSSATKQPSAHDPTTRIIAHNPTYSPYVTLSPITQTITSQSNNVPPNINNSDRKSLFPVWSTAIAIACGVSVCGLCAAYLLWRSCNKQTIDVQQSLNYIVDRNVSVEEVKSQNIIALETVTKNGRNTNNSVSDQSDYGENDDGENDGEESSTFSVSKKEEDSVKEGTTKTGEEIKIKLPQINRTKGE